MLPAFTHRYLITAMEGTPDVLESLLKSIGASDPIWDFRPDPERFTLREIVAHIADWNPIFQERVTRTRDEDKPDLPGYDEGKFAIERDYASRNPLAELQRFRSTRHALVQAFRAMEGAQWERVGYYVYTGAKTPLTIEAWATQIVGHDGYHMSQVAQWLNAAQPKMWES